MGTARSQDLIGVYVHLVWGTWDRLPLITKDVEVQLHRCIKAEAKGLGCSELALNGTLDHVHLLLQCPSTLALSTVVKQAKGASSHLTNAVLAPGTTFKWQPSYGAFSVSRWDIPRITRYVQLQKEHHSMGELAPDLEPPSLQPRGP